MSEQKQPPQTASEIFSKIKELQKSAPVKWKVQSVVSKKEDGTCKLLCVCYFDARIVVDHLNEAFGFLNWQREHYRLDGKEYCRIKVRNPENGDWITYEDTGSKSKTEGAKGETSDAFKRAAVNLGIGRDNYESDTFFVKGMHGVRNGKDWSYPVDANGKRVWNLTLHVRALLSGMAPEDGSPEDDAPETPKTPEQEKKRNKVIEQINELGLEFPDLLANCEKHAKDEGFDSIADARDGLLAAYLVKLQLEKKNAQSEENAITPVK